MLSERDKQLHHMPNTLSFTTTILVSLRRLFRTVLHKCLDRFVKSQGYTHPYEGLFLLWSPFLLLTTVMQQGALTLYIHTLQLRKDKPLISFSSRRLLRERIVGVPVWIFRAVVCGPFPGDKRDVLAQAQRKVGLRG